jgi:hypothetical protein
MKIEVKSEIHDCTIEIVKFLENQEIFEKGTFKLLKQDKNLRIDNQYYLKNKKVNYNYQDLLEFVLGIKEILNKLNNDNVLLIRKKLKEILNN